MSMKIEVNVTGTEPLTRAINALTKALSDANILQQAGEKEPSERNCKDATPATLEEVRAKLASLSQSGKQKEVKALIQKYGANKLSAIPAEKYIGLLKDAEEI